LRNRLADLQGIADGFLQFFAGQCGKHLKGFTAEAAQALRQYPWPGNVRELRNVIERAVILAGSGEITVADLPEKLSQKAEEPDPRCLQIGARLSLEELENEHIARIVEQAGTMEEAARILGIDPATLYRKRKKMAA
jgi:NtrC-family two-component system response regulator AlgB